MSKELDPDLHRSGVSFKEIKSTELGIWSNFDFDGGGYAEEEFLGRRNGSGVIYLTRTKLSNLTSNEIC